MYESKLLLILLMENLLGNEIKFISISFSVIPEIYILGLKMLIQITFFFSLYEEGS